MQADGKILVGGLFNSIGGQTRNRIARLDATTGLADSFDPNANNMVYPIAVQADGKILAGGHFTSIGGQARNRIARLDPTTGLAIRSTQTRTSLSIPLCFRRMARFWWAAVSQHRRTDAQQIARLDPTTGLADSFDPNANNVSSIAVQADGKILVGGISTASADSRASHRPALQRPARLIRSTRTRTMCLFHRAAGGRQDFGRVAFHFEQHRRAIAQPHRPARCYDRFG